MTTSAAGWIRAGFVAGILAVVAYPAQAQNLTYFREYDIQPPANNQPGFTSDGRGGLYASTGDTLRKYDSGGFELWSKQIGIVPALGAVIVLAANASGVFVAGGTLSGIVLPGQTSLGKGDAFVRRYDPDGRELWTRQFGTPEFETVHVVAADATAVYVAGVTVSSSQTAATEFVSKFDASGNQLWTSRFNTGGGTLVNAAADSAGVYVTSGHGEPPVLRRFDARGTEVWSTQLDRSNGRRAVVAADESGAYVLLADTLLRRYDQSGSEAWRRQLPNQNFDLVADSTGVFVLGGTDRALPGQCYAGSFDFAVRRYTPGGDQTWARQFGTAWVDNVVGIEVDGTGAYVYGYHQPNPGPDGSPPPRVTFLAKFEKVSAPSANSQPRILHECVLNAASYLGGGVAPGEIVVIFGSSMGPIEFAPLRLTSDGGVPSTLAGVRILFDGEPAPLIYVSDKQSSAIVPYSVATKSSVNVQVEYNGVLSSAVRMPVFQSRLGVFTLNNSGSGQAAIVNEDGTVNSPLNPAARGSVVSIYTTGAGLPQPAAPDNQITRDFLSSFKSLAYVRLVSSGADEEFPYFAAQVLHYGGAPRSLPGLAQINARLPLDAPPGEAVPLFYGVSPGAFDEQYVTIAIH